MKLELIKRLEETGLGTIELTSVVSPRRIPQLADCRDVLGDEGIRRMGGKDLRLPVLVPTAKGLDVAIEYGVKEVAVFISATEGFSKANINCSVEQGIERAGCGLSSAEIKYCCSRVSDLASHSSGFLC